MEVVPFVLDGEHLLDMHLPGDTTEFPGANVQESIKQTGVWAPAECRILRDHIRCRGGSKGLMVDVGANTGVFGLLAMRFGWDVLFVDANDVHRKYIEASIENADFSGEHRFVRSFVGDKDGESVPFDGWSGNERMMNAEVTTMVPQVTLDTLVPDGCDFLKIDVEGAEDRVIAGASELLKAGKLPIIMFEVTYYIHGEMNVAQTDVLKILQGHGYELYEIFDDRLAPVGNVDVQVQRWYDDLVKYHIPAQPGLTLAGTNMLAVLRPASTV